MLLSAQLLADVADVNRYRAVNQVSARAGSTIDVFFRLVDRDQDQDASPPGRRFMPASRSTLRVTIKGVDARKQLAYAARQPFPQDPSIWAFTIKPEDGKVAPAPHNGPVVDWSSLVPLGQPFDYNAGITDFGMVGTFGLQLTLTENPSFRSTVTLQGVAPGNTLVVNGIEFLAVAAGATGAQFDVGPNDDVTAQNLAAAITAAAGVCQASATASGAVVTVLATGTATLTISGDACFTIAAPVLGASARVTTGWAPQAISIQPSFPAV